jgi:microcystin-dependent protein
MFGGTVAPPGHLLCDGSPLNRVTYAALFTEIGEKFGNGDGSTTFNLPDSRGRFMRGADNGAGNDPDIALRYAIAGGNTGLTPDTLGSYQADELRSHAHAGPNAHPAAGMGIQSNSGQQVQFNGGVYATGGNETRPLNLYVNHIIKY